MWLHEGHSCGFHFQFRFQSVPRQATICYYGEMVWYVDADSFPVQARDIIQKRARKAEVSLFYVGCTAIRRNPADIHEMVICAAGDGVADDWIKAHAGPGDLVFTRDIPLAGALLELGVTVLNDRGVRFDPGTIRERLSQRDFMAGLRAAGLASMGGHGYGEKEKKAFADTLDRTLASLAMRQ